MIKLPQIWHVAITPESSKIVGEYYASKASTCYLHPASEWKFYRSHTRSGVCIMEGNMLESNFAERNEDFAVKTGSVLLSLEDFVRLVVNSPNPFPKCWYIEVTPENFDTIGKWRTDGMFGAFTKHNAHGYCSSPRGFYTKTEPKEHQRISFEDFRRHILGESFPESVSSTLNSISMSNSALIIKVPKI